MQSEVKTFYSGANVLITGATGLFGQMLIQKLLRECADVEKIYLIVREKNEKSGWERMVSALDNPVFDKLKSVNPDFLNKIHVFDGDCSLPKLGLEPSSVELLTQKVNVVFHCAGNLNMEAKLKDAVDTNIRSVMELIDLCHEMPKLKAAMFVSTAYSQCIHKVIEEKFYDPPLQPETVMKLREEADSAILEKITPGLIGSWPNTYAYSKSIAEELISKNVGIIPVGLFRPSIVMSTYLDPTPGWTSNLYGPLGYFFPIRMGLLRVLYCNPNGKLSFVPADYCVNALICTAWETHTNFTSSSSQTSVYNYSGGKNQNLPIKDMFRFAVESKYAFKHVAWAISVSYIQSKHLFLFLRMLLHYLPAYLLDFYLLITGKTTRFIKYQRKISKLSNILSFFSLREWNIKNDNVERLWTRLNESDKASFPFNMDTVDYKRFLENSVLGIKLYILKESLENLDEDIMRYQRLIKLDRIFKMVVTSLLVVLFFMIWSSCSLKT